MKNDTTFVRMLGGDHLGDAKTITLCALFSLRPVGGVKHSDSNLVETDMLSAKKALR